MSKAISYNEVKIIDRETVKFGDPIFDNYISDAGGIELGTMIALSGTSGAGKTTLCKKWQKDLKPGEKSIFFALESLKGSVARQTKRIKTGEDELICDVTDFPTWSGFMKYLYESKPLMVAVDSLQHAAKLLSKENGKYKYANYQEIVKDLYTWKDETQGIVILIVQLNGEGKMEGPESTVFDVDCPIKITSNPKTGERFMETEKNRMGPVGKIFYDFVETDDCIKFYTVDQWQVMKKGATIISMVQNTVESFTQVYKDHDNYKAFKKELVKEYNKIYSASPNDTALILTQTIILIDRLSKEYF